MHTIRRTIVVALAVASCAGKAHADQPEVRHAIFGEVYNPCPEGVPSATMPNYVQESGPANGPYCLDFQIRSDGPGNIGGWIQATAVPELCGIMTDGRLKMLFQRISQCGVVLFGAGGWDSPGAMFWPGFPLKVEAWRVGPELEKLVGAERAERMRALTRAEMQRAEERARTRRVR